MKTKSEVEKMKDTGIVRRIDEMGRLVLPKEMRNKMDIKDGDEIEFYADGDMIVLRKYQPCCFFCKSNYALIEYKGKRICSACVADMKQSL